MLFDKRAGAWLAGLVGIAWLLGGACALMLTLGTQSGLPSAIAWLLVPGAVALVVAGFLARRGLPTQNLEKGARSEKKVGQAVEYALCPDTCAVAHGVNKIAAVGDIDHLVALPEGLWVIETKTSRVPESEFPEVLRRIARNVESVRAWAQQWESEVQVTGCLVFAYDDRPVRQSFEREGETIKAFANPNALVRALRAEARKDGGSPVIARKVWELGKIDEAEDQDGF